MPFPAVGNDHNRGGFTPPTKAITGLVVGLQRLDALVVRRRHWGYAGGLNQALAKALDAAVVYR